MPDRSLLSAAQRSLDVHSAGGLTLAHDAGGWSLQDQDGALGPLQVDFASGALNYRRARGKDRQQGLGRAAGKPVPGEPPALIDATGGLGTDAFVLAHLGWQVTLLERSPALVTLLADGVARGRCNAEVSAICRRMRVLHREAQAFLDGLAPAERPQVVYLDPMYPTDPRSALPGREMQYLRRLLGNTPPDTGLLPAARRAARHRVVVKRPAAAPPLSDVAPSHAIRMGGTRFDVYLTPA
ncbi:MAG: class I SAM-dependent methyltransferase [Pseudomonadota bacterium]